MPQVRGSHRTTGRFAHRSVYLDSNIACSGCAERRILTGCAARSRWPLNCVPLGIREKNR